MTLARWRVVVTLRDGDEFAWHYTTRKEARLAAAWLHALAKEGRTRWVLLDSATEMTVRADELKTARVVDEGDE